MVDPHKPEYYLIILRMVPPSKLLPASLREPPDARAAENQLNLDMDFPVRGHKKAMTSQQLQDLENTG